MANNILIYIGVMMTGAGGVCVILFWLDAKRAARIQRDREKFTRAFEEAAKGYAPKGDK